MSETEPFDPFRPSARRGATLLHALHQKLASSFEHLHEACRPHVWLDDEAIGTSVALIATAPAVRPELFVVHYDCREAALRNDLDGVARAFGALCGAIIAAPPGVRFRNWADDGFSAGELARYQWAFCDEGDTPIALTTTPHELFDRARRTLDAALSVVRVADPDLFGEISALVREVVLAQSVIGAAMTFDGITSVNAFGALVLNPAELQTTPGALASLVHESAHSLLFAAGEGHSMVENDPRARYASPLRLDQRPMDGVFHATFVSARMAYALERALAANAFAADDSAEAGALLGAARRAFAAGYDVVVQHGRPTPLGAGFLRGAAAHMNGSRVRA